MVSGNIHRLFLRRIMHFHICGYFVAIYFLLCGCYANGQHSSVLNSYVLSGRAQGTTYQIKYYAKEEISKQEVDSILKVIDRSMSLYDPTSAICKFNDTDVSRIEMDDHMRKVVKASFKTYKETDGYFDITVYPLVKLWGFGPEGVRKDPSLKEIDSVKRIIGINKLRVRGNQLIKRDKHVSIDLNGIAQGYTVDVLAEHLEAKGIQNFLVELGGEIRTRGRKTNGPFVVEIYRPKNVGVDHVYKVCLQNKAITTSGSYERQRKIVNKTVSHHMNPLTGQPLESAVVSATVIARTAMEADALDNYFMYLAPQEAIKFANKREGIEVYLVYFEDNTFKELQSSGFNNYIY